MAVQHNLLLTLPPELIWELLYIIILDHLHSVFCHEETWNAVVVLPSICREIRSVTLSIYSNVFNIPQEPDGSLTRNPHPDIERIASIDRGLTVPVEDIDQPKFAQLYKAVLEGVLFHQDHDRGLLGVYSTAARQRCCLAYAFGRLELGNYPEIYQLRHEYAQSLQSLLIGLITALKPQRLSSLVSEFLIPESLETMLTLDLTMLTYSVEQVVYRYKNPNAVDSMPGYSPKEAYDYVLSLTTILEFLDSQDSSVILPLVPISTRTAYKSLITPRLLKLTEIIYPLYEATQAIPEDENDKDKIHTRIQRVYNKWDSIIRNDNLARGLPAPDHDQPWDEEEPIAAGQ